MHPNTQIEIDGNLSETKMKIRAWVFDLNLSKIEHQNVGSLISICLITVIFMDN